MTTRWYWCRTCGNPMTVDPADTWTVNTNVWVFYAFVNGAERVVHRCPQGLTA